MRLFLTGLLVTLLIVACSDTHVSSKAAVVGAPEMTADTLPPKWLVGWRPGDPLPVTQTPYGSPVTPHHDPPCAPPHLAAEAKRYNVPVCNTLDTLGGRVFRAVH